MNLECVCHYTHCFTIVYTHYFLIRQLNVFLSSTLSNTIVIHTIIVILPLFSLGHQFNLLNNETHRFRRCVSVETLSHDVTGISRWSRTMGVLHRQWKPTGSWSSGHLLLYPIYSHCFTVQVVYWKGCSVQCNLMTAHCNPLKQFCYTVSIIIIIIILISSWNVNVYVY